MNNGDKNGFLEKGYGISSSLRVLPHSFNIKNVTAASVATVFSLAGPVLLLTNIANQANLSNEATGSWLMMIYLGSGILMMGLTLYYRQPIAIAFSLPGIVVVGGLLKIFSLEQMVAGYILGGAILLLIGVSGLIKTITRYLPVPIIMGMIAGALFSFATGIVTSVQKDPTGAGLTLLAFLLAGLLLKKVPPILVALIVGIVASLLVMKSKVLSGAMGFNLPVFYKPDFTFAAIISISIPLLMMELADFLKGYGILRANGYEAPINTMITSTGLFTVLVSCFLAHTITVAGPITAITSDKDAGPHEHRWVAAFLKGAVQVVVALLGGYLVPFLRALPTTVSSVLAGLAMLNLFLGAFEVAFGSGSRFKLGAFCAFIVAFSNIQIFSIGAPVWALLSGVVISLIFERENVKSFVDPIPVSQVSHTL